MSKAHFVIVHGYGCHLVPELTGYLDGVVEFVNRRKPDYLILCGGATQKKTAPNTTEAALMAIYIRERLTHVPEFIIEDHSYTTLENVQNAMYVIHGKHGLAMFTWLGIEVDVFCEAQRALKTLILYWFLFPEIRKFGKRVRVHTSSWELANPLKELRNTLYDLAALWVPGLAWYAHRQRVKRSGTI